MNAFFETMAVLIFVCVLTGGFVLLYTRKPKVESEITEKISLQEARPLIISQLQSVSELALVKSKECEKISVNRNFCGNG